VIFLCGVSALMVCFVGGTDRIGVGGLETEVRAGAGVGTEVGTQVRAGAGVGTQVRLLAIQTTKCTSSQSFTFRSSVSL
jgi:hypothetical protein